MAQYAVKLTDDDGVVIDTGPGAPALSEVRLYYKVRTYDELSYAVDALGFHVPFMGDEFATHARINLEVTRDGEAVGSASVVLQLEGDLAAGLEVAAPPITAIVQLKRNREEAGRG